MARVYAERKYPPMNEIDIPESVVCNVPSEHYPILRVAMQVSAYLFFLLPMIYVVVLYTMIGMKIRKSLFAPLFRGQNEDLRRASRLIPTSISKTSSTEKNAANSQFWLERFRKRTSIIGTSIRRRLRKSDGSDTEANPSLYNRRSTAQASRKKAGAPLYLFGVVIAFFICWCPFHLQRLLSIYLAFDLFVKHQSFFNVLFNISGKKLDLFTSICLSIFRLVLGILFYVSPTINPILYSLLSSKFRRAFVDTFCCRENRKLSRAVSQQSGTSFKTSNGSFMRVNKPPQAHYRNRQSLPNTAEIMMPIDEYSLSPIRHQLKSALKPKSQPSIPASCEKRDSIAQTDLTFPSSSNIDIPSLNAHRESVKTVNVNFHKTNFLFVEFIIVFSKFDATTATNENMQNVLSGSMPKLVQYRDSFQSYIIPGESTQSTPAKLPNSFRAKFVEDTFEEFGDDSRNADLVEKISSVYDGSLADEIQLECRIRHLTPTSGRRARILMAYGALHDYPQGVGSLDYLLHPSPGGKETAPLAVLEQPPSQCNNDNKTIKMSSYEIHTDLLKESYL